MTQVVARSSEEPFRRKTVGWLIGVASASFVLALVLSVVTSENLDTRSAGADAYSRSALGHHGLVDVLRKLKVPVVVSQHGSVAKAGSSALLVLAEPKAGGELAQMLKDAHSTLVVLPKWSGSPQVLKPEWIRTADLLSATEVTAVLSALQVDGESLGATLVRPRPGELSGWHGGPAPTLPFPQLVTSEALDPIVWCDKGILLGEVKGTRLRVLADPDLLSNHGLGQGENAPLALQVIDKLRGEGGAVVFDETLHGHQVKPTLWRQLFQFPLVLPLIQAALAALVLLWAGMGRFGAPVPESPTIEPGKRFLIQNTADLLRFGGHTRHALVSYLRLTVNEAGRALHAPASLDAVGLRRWLNRVGEARGVSDTLEKLDSEVGSLAEGGQAASVRVVTTAQRIYRWRQEIVHGSTNHPRH